MTPVTHHGRSPSTDRQTSAAPMIALSAIGSAIFPKSVTRLYVRARCPSNTSVIMATAKAAQAQARHRRVVAAVREQQHARSPARARSRSMVEDVGDVPEAGLVDGRSTQLAAGRRRSAGTARRGRRDSGHLAASSTPRRSNSATRSTPSVPTTFASTIRPGARPALCSEDHLAVGLGRLVRGAADGTVLVAVHASRPGPARSRRGAPRRAARSAPRPAATGARAARRWRPRPACRRSRRASVPSSSE